MPRPDSINPKNFVIAPYSDTVRDGLVFLSLDVDQVSSYHREVDTPLIDKMEMFPAVEYGVDLNVKCTLLSGISTSLASRDLDKDHKPKGSRRMIYATNNNEIPASMNAGKYSQSWNAFLGSIINRTTRTIYADLYLGTDFDNYINPEIPVIYKSPV